MAGELPRVAVLVSGLGTTLDAMLRQGDALGGRIVGVVSSRPDVLALGIAHAAGVRTAVNRASDFADRASADAALVDLLRSWAVDWVVLAGWMRILGDDFVTSFAGRLVNSHPGKVPEYAGLHPIRRALEAGEEEVHITVHLVAPGPVDHGPRIATGRIPVLADDTEASLTARVKGVEKGVYLGALADLFGGRHASTSEELAARVR